MPLGLSALSIFGCENGSTLAILTNLTLVCLRSCRSLLTMNLCCRRPRPPEYDRSLLAMNLCCRRPRLPEYDRSLLPMNLWCRRPRLPEYEWTILTRFFRQFLPVSPCKFDRQIIASR